MLLLALLVVSAAPAVAQEPASLEPAVRAARASYTAPLSPAQLGELLNRVAWDHRTTGWGLLAKPAGTNCPTPSGILVACDILVHRPSGLHFDALGSSETLATPTWLNHGPIDVARFVTPTDPGGDTPPPPPPPDDAALRARIAALEAELASLSVARRLDAARIAELEADIVRHHADIAQALQERDDARRERDVLLAQPAPSCEAKVPGWLRALGIRVGCRIVER